MRWWQIVAIAIMIVVFPAYSLVAMVFFAPVFIIHGLRPDVGDSAVAPASFTVLAVAVHPVHALWLAGGTWPAGMALVFNTRLLAADYMAGAFAWIVVEITALSLRAIGDRERVVQMRRLQAQVKEVRTEWQIPEAEPAEN